MSTPTTIDATTTAAKASGWAGQSTGERIFSVAIFGVSTAVSVAMAYYLFTDPSKLTAVWAWIRSLPLLVQLGFWLLCLPWMIALWVWSLPWAFALKFALVLALLAFTEFLVWPIK